MNKNKLIIAVGAVVACAAALLPSLSLAEGRQEVSSAEALVVRLKGLVPSSPAVATKEVVDVMSQAASTKRLDVASMLIKCLAFNYPPGASNETLTHAQMIPAIGLLKKEYGIQVLPFLFTEGIATDKSWLRTRCALAIRELATTKEIEAMTTTFSLDVSASQSAKDLLALLKAKDLKVEMADPLRELGRSIDSAIGKTTPEGGK